MKAEAATLLGWRLIEIGSGGSAEPAYARLARGRDEDDDDGVLVEISREQALALAPLLYKAIVIEIGAGESMSDADAELRGSEIERDLGIAQQHRARLKARIAGNVASGPLMRVAIVASDREHGASFEYQGMSADAAAEVSCDVAEAILRRCGL